MGVGSRLLRHLLVSLASPADHPKYYSEPREKQSVRQVIACMAVDTDGPGQGLSLKKFYKQHGFKEVGHFKDVGYKFDRW